MTGVVRSTGRGYSDGVERWTIDIGMDDAGGLPSVPGARVPITLEIDRETFTAGLRTTSHDPRVYVCADLVDADGGRARLGEVLRTQFARNQRAELTFQRGRLLVSPIP